MSRAAHLLVEPARPVESNMAPILLQLDIYGAHLALIDSKISYIFLGIANNALFPRTTDLFTAQWHAVPDGSGGVALSLEGVPGAQPSRLKRQGAVLRSVLSERSRALLRGRSTGAT